ncbi:MAG: hypothetical protein QM619_11780 [Micropruina sp.]|uniref:hypothetical protein n=1 Tax=Micropruina sp. TaxID=2737536 RepID=UPI0039E6F515
MLAVYQAEAAETVEIVGERLVAAASIEFGQDRADMAQSAARSEGSLRHGKKEFTTSPGRFTMRFASEDFMHEIDPGGTPLHILHRRDLLAEHVDESVDGIPDETMHIALCRGGCEPGIVPGARPVVVV